VVTLQCLLEKLPERLRLRDISRLPPPDLVRQELLEQHQPQVLLRLVLEGLEELLVQNRDVGALEAGGGEDVHDAFRLHGIVHQVADRLLDRALLVASGQRLSQLIPHPLAEDDFVGVLPAVVEVLDEQKGGREPRLCIEEVVTAHLVLGHNSVDQ
jgi:hypothetical protein